MKKKITVVNDGPGSRVHKGGQDYRVPLGRHSIEDLAEEWGVTEKEALTIAQEYAVTQIAGCRIEVESPQEEEEEGVFFEDDEDLGAGVEIDEDSDEDSKEPPEAEEYEWEGDEDEDEDGEEEVSRESTRAPRTKKKKAPRKK